MISFKYISDVIQHMLLIAFNSLLCSLQLGQGALIHVGYIDGLVNDLLLVVSVSSLPPDVLLEVLVVDNHVLITVFFQFFLVLDTDMLEEVGFGHA